MTLSRVWAWSKGCSLFDSVTAEFDITEALSCIDDQAGTNCYSLQLNVGTPDGRALQNVIQFYNDPKVYGKPTWFWQTDITDQNGVVSNTSGFKNIEAIPFPTDFDPLTPPYGVALGLSSDLVASLVFLKSGVPVCMASKQAASFYSSKFASVNPIVVGAGNGSVATFTAGKLTVLTTFASIGDLMSDGIWFPSGKYQPPSICGYRTPQTMENSNLVYDTLEQSNASLRLLARV